jgi:hypothetical protein
MKKAKREALRHTRHMENTKRRQERAYAAIAADAKRYYGVPKAHYTVLARLVAWRKGEKCKPYDRSTRWVDVNPWYLHEMKENYQLKSLISGGETGRRWP